MTALIILAAGASGRMGQPKQNLLFQNQTLLQRAVKTGLATDCRPVIVILGANVGAIEMNDQDDVKVLYNAHWNEGMASSIRLAINEIEQVLGIDQVIIMLCDQPFVTPAVIEALLHKSTETGALKIASAYNNTLGPPALFNRALFKELLLLKGNEGAKKVLRSQGSATISVPFELGSFDIDTMGDYQQLLEKGA